MAGGVTRMVKQPGESGCFWIEPVRNATVPVFSSRCEIRRDPPARGELPSHQCRPRWRTNRRVHVELCKPNPLLGHPIDTRRLNLLLSVTRKVRIAHIVDEHEKKIRALSGQKRRRDKEQGKKKALTIHCRPAMPTDFVAADAGQLHSQCEPSHLA